MNPEQIVELGGGAKAADQLALARFRGWSVISNAPVNTGSLSTAATAYSRLTRLEQVSPHNFEAVVLGFANFYAAPIGEAPTPDPIVVAASWQEINVAISALGASINDATTTPNIPFTFGGKEEVVLAPRTFAFTDPLITRGIGGKRNFTKTLQRLMPWAAPAAPTVAGSTSGGGIAAGTYQIAVRAHYPGGFATPGSTSAAVTLTGSTSSVTVTSPSAATFPGAIGYSTWISLVGATTPLYDTGKGVVPFGVDTVLIGTPSTSAVASERRVLNGQVAQAPVGAVTNGSSVAGASNNGEYNATNIDLIHDGSAVNPNVSGSGFGPFVVLGLDPKRVHRSMAFVGDSIGRGVADYGFKNASGGGYLQRAVTGQLGRFYDPTIAPLFGHINLCIPGETAGQFAAATGKLRRQQAALATDIGDEYGTNDLSGGATASTMVSYTYDNAVWFTGLGRRYWKFTVTPRTGSTDGWKTVANQFLPLSGVSINYPGAMLQFNNWLFGGASRAVANEAMFASYAAATPATNFYAGGNGTATVFQTSLPFIQGSEVIKVAGATKALTTDYTYLGAVTLSNGLQIASGVTFNSAPANGASVTASFTSLADLTTLAGPLAKPVDLRRIVHVDGAGGYTNNGVWWAPAAATGLDTGTADGSNTTLTLVSTAKNYAQDIYRNYVVRITADPVTPAAVGQQQVITKITGTTITVPGWTTVPSSSATFEIFDPINLEGTHAVGKGHMNLAAAVPINAMLS